MRAETTTRACECAAWIAALGLVLSSVFTLIPDTATAQGFVGPNAFLPNRGDAPVEIHGITRTLAPRWKASYGLAPADQTALTSALLRFDQTLAFGTRSDGASRNDWRHFLGLEYAPGSGFAFNGGIAKSSGIRGSKSGGLSPTGYEGLRLNAGARWQGTAWGLDSSFSFIPTGASRVPSDAGFFPGMGGDSSTYLFSLTISRRF